MANVVKRFVNEAILRNELKVWGAYFRLNDGKYYKSTVARYNRKEAERYFKKYCGNLTFNEFEPTENLKEMIKLHDYLYVYLIED